MPGSLSREDAVISPGQLDRALQAQQLEVTRPNARPVRCSNLACRRLIPRGEGRRCPGYLRDWLAGIVAAGEQCGLVGVVVWKPKRTPDRDALVVVRFRNWCDLHVGGPGQKIPAVAALYGERVP